MFSTRRLMMWEVVRELVAGLVRIYFLYKVTIVQCYSGQVHFLWPKAQRLESALGAVVA